MDFSIILEGPEANDYLCTNWFPRCLPTKAKRLPTNPHHLPELARCTCKQQIIRKSVKEKKYQTWQLKHSSVSNSAWGDAAVPVSLHCWKPATAAAAQWNWENSRQEGQMHLPAPPDVLWSISIWCWRCAEAPREAQEKISTKQAMPQLYKCQDS